MPKRVDRNQSEIVEALRKSGATVQDLHEVGHGCPDILVGWAGRNYLFEIKTPGGVLNDREVSWNMKWEGQARVIYTVEDALKVMGRIK